jgi:Zn finger protein HypA/HybF involved in hydrogenase expression
MIDTLEEVARQNELTAIQRVTFNLGEVSGVLPDYLVDCWNWAVKRTDVLHDAVLDVVPVAAVTVCNDCGRTYGTVTYGKGTVQRILSLPDGTGLGISYSMYYPPFSDNYEGIGVQPDYPCEMDAKLANKSIYKITDAEDTQLQKAIEVLGKAE